MASSLALTNVDTIPVVGIWFEPGSPHQLLGMDEPSAMPGDRVGLRGWPSRARIAALDGPMAGFNTVERLLKQGPGQCERIGVERGFHPDMVR